MFKSYLIGFILSVLLTLAAFFVVLRPGFFHLGSSVVIVTILIFAVTQLLVQLFFFLHLGSESGPRWNLAILVSTISIILILVVGSLWIMNHLNYNMTLPAPFDNRYLINQ